MVLVETNPSSTAPNDTVQEGPTNLASDKTCDVAEDSKSGEPRETNSDAVTFKPQTVGEETSSVAAIEPNGVAPAQDGQSSTD